MAPKKRESLSVDDKRLHNYEMVFIVSPEVADDSLETAIDGISKFITSKGGTVSNIERWGKRRLSYPLKHFSEGNYVLTGFQMNPMWSKELEANLHISEDILRHLLIKLDS